MEILQESGEQSAKAKTVTSKRSNKSIKITKETLDMVDISVSQGIEEAFGPRKLYEQPMSPKFLEKLETICDIGPFPVPIIRELEKSGFNSPHTLINTFGGGISNLAMHLAYMRISLFIHEYPKLTTALFTMSRILLKIPFSAINTDPDKWIDQKKTKAYDRTFTALDNLEVIQLKNKSQDKQYMTQIK